MEIAWKLYNVEHIIEINKLVKTFGVIWRNKIQVIMMCEYIRIESEGSYLTRPLPLFLVRELEAGKKLFYWERKRNKAYRILLQLKRLGLTEYYCPETKQEKPVEIDRLLNFLGGRCLLGSEVKRLLVRQGLKSPEILSALRQNALVEPGLKNGRCSRCGSSDLAVRQCHFLPQRQCFYCLSCLSMGECRTCSEVWFFAPVSRKPEMKNICFKPEFTLTRPQQAASEELLSFWNSEAKACLLWAVCGAGKTEVCYQLIFTVLKSGGRVLLAIPRRDVVQELALRLKAVFPGLAVNVLYGGSPKEYRECSLTVATAHQALRFYCNFSLVILDEADAYPYRENAMLRLAVLRAAGKSKIVYLTATPEKELLKLSRIRIPARHHGYPLPEPEFCRVRFGRTAVPKQVLIFLHGLLAEKEQAFIFLPSIRQVKSYGRILQELLGRERVDFSWSSDPEREMKKVRFTAGKSAFLVTTTIMERGVTVPGVNVAVLFANQESVFTTASLVQMAGRVGRKTASGRVVFFAGGVSEAMQEAKKEIKEFNLEARKKGYIR